MEKIYTFNNGDTFSVSATNRKVTHIPFARGYSGDPTHYTYTIVIKHNDRSESFAFHDSIFNYQSGKGATEDMLFNALDCIMSDYYAFVNNNSPEEFADEFGYDYWGDKRRVNQIWSAINDNGAKMNRLFTPDELNMIQNEILATL